RPREAARRPPAAEPHLPWRGGERRPQRARPLKARRRNGPRRLAAAPPHEDPRKSRCNGDAEIVPSVPFPARESLQFLCVSPPGAVPCSHRLTGNGLPGEEQEMKHLARVQPDSAHGRAANVEDLTH